MSCREQVHPRCVSSDSRCNQRSVANLSATAQSQRRQRNHSAAGIADVQLEQIFDLKAALVLGLHDDTLHAAGIRKVVDIGRSEVGGDRVVDVGEGHTERVRLFAIDHQQNLRRIRKAFHTHAGQHRTLPSLLHQFGSRSRQSSLANTIAVLKAECEAARGTETFDSRRKAQSWSHP